jgi:O-antigen/teichoic acid export membrane protein
MLEPPRSVRRFALHGAAVMGAAQAVRIAGQLGSVVVLSRLLSPDDFGVTAAVAPIVAFMAIFQDLGLQQAIIQRAEISQRDLSDIFWLSLSMGGAVTLAMVALAPLAVVFFHDRRLLWVTMAAALPLMAYAAASVPTALLNRGGRFATLAAGDILAAVVSLGTAVLAASLGLRYWSLLIAAIVTGLVAAIFAAVQAAWRPDAPRLAAPDGGLLRFGGNLTGFTAVNFLARNADNLLIGHACGSVQLGFYDRAYKLLLLPLQTVSYPLARVMIPLLSRMEADKPRVRAVYLRVVAQLALAVVPGMAAMVAAAPTVVALLFGPRWAAVTPIFLWLGLAGLVQPVNSTAGWLFISQARTRSMFRLGIYTAATTVVSFAAGLHWGAAGVAAAYAISEYVFRLPVQYWWIGRVGPVGAVDLAGIQAPLLAAAGMTWLVAHFVFFGMQGLGLIAVTLAASYGFAVGCLSTVPIGRAALREISVLVGSQPTKVFWSFFSKKDSFLLESTPR